MTMKKTKFAKIVSLIFVCAVLMGILFVTAFAAGEESKPEIVAHNVYYGDTFHIMYAINNAEGADISATCVIDGEEVELSVVPFIDGDTQVIANFNGGSYPAYIIEEGFAAQAIDTVVTLTVAAGENVVTEKYSVLQYTYERTEDLKTTTPADDEAATKIAREIKMLGSLVEHATDAEYFFDGKSDIESSYHVAVENGTIDGINDSGMFLKSATPFANIATTLDYDSAAYGVVWDVTVDGGEVSRYTNEEIKSLAVNGNMTVSAVVLELGLIEENSEFTIDADDLANNMIDYFNTASSDYKPGHTLVTDEDIPYARFTGSAANSITQVFFVKNYWQSNGCINAGESANVKDAYLLVIKMRTNTAETVQLHIGGYKETSSDTENKGTKVGLTFKTVASEKDWTTYVVDLSALVPSWKVDENGDYTLHNCYFHIPNHASTDNVDVAYIAFCDSWEDVASYTGEETALKLLKADGTSTSKVNTADGNCATHTYATVDGENGTKTVKCSVCGYVVKTVTATYYKTPDELVAIGTTGNWFNGSSETKVVTEDGKTYASYIHGAATGGCITFYKENSKVAQGEEFNSGKYIVMKFRVRNGIGGLILQNATGEGSAVKGVKHTFTQSENGWQVAVIDLSQFQNYTTDTTTSWAALGLTTGASANTNATLDVEYFAIVSSLDNVASIIDEDTYDYYADWTQAPEKKSVNAQ